MDSLGLKILLLKESETEWRSKSSVEISTDISHLDTKNSRESDTIKKSRHDLLFCPFFGRYEKSLRSGWRARKGLESW